MRRLKQHGYIRPPQTVDIETENQFLSIGKLPLTKVQSTSEVKIEKNEKPEKKKSKK